MQAMLPEGFPLYVVEFNLLQWVLSACVAAVNCRPLLHHCAVYFSVPQGSWIACCLHLKIELR